MPALEALQERFRKANTQVVGVSIDSVYSHANWGQSVGGVSFPLLSDFHPKGAVAKSLGVYLEDKGITDRATIIIDADGVVQYAESVGPGGSRNIEDLAAACEKVNQIYDKPLPPFEAPKGIPNGTKLYVKSNCGFSQAAMLARDNLHLNNLSVANVSNDTSAMTALEKIAGKAQAPCLVVDGEAQLESKDIIATLVEAACPV